MSKNETNKSQCGVDELLSLFCFCIERKMITFCCMYLDPLCVVCVSDINLCCSQTTINFDLSLSCFVVATPISSCLSSAHDNDNGCSTDEHKNRSAHSTIRRSNNKIIMRALATCCADSGSIVHYGELLVCVMRVSFRRASVIRTCARSRTLLVVPCSHRRRVCGARRANWRAGERRRDVGAVRCGAVCGGGR